MELSVLELNREFGLNFLPVVLSGALVLVWPSLSQLALFACSLSFHTSLLSWIYLWTRDPRLGRAAVTQSLFTPLTWLAIPSNPDPDDTGRLLNWLLYFSPAIYLLPYWIQSGDCFSSTAIPPLIWTYWIGYLIVLPLFDWYFEWQFFPVVNPVALLTMASLSQAMSFSIPYSRALEGDSE